MISDLIPRCAAASVPALLALAASTAGHATDGVTTNSVGMDLVAIPAGRYLRGGEPHVSSLGREDQPRHQVAITRPFRIGRTEATRAQWKRVMGTAAPDLGMAGVTDDHPVVGVTWYDAVDFCRRLSAREGRTYRLPTEAEWEYACRAGTTTRFGVGATLSTDLANYDPFYLVPAKDRGIRPAHEVDPRAARPGTTAVGSFTPNAWGLSDVHGNAQEWCFDFYDGDHYLYDAIARFYASLSGPDQQKHSFHAIEQVKPEERALYAPDCPTSQELRRDPSAERLKLAVALVATDPIGPSRGNAGKRALRGGCWRSAAADCLAAARKGADPSWRNDTIGLRVVLEDGPAGLAATMVAPAAPGSAEVAGFGTLPEAFVNTLGCRFQLIRPGVYQMGLSPYEARLLKTAPTARPVTIAKPFYLAVIEVTGGAAALIDQPHRYAQEFAVGGPSALDITDVALRTSQREGRRYRLPADAEWEYACRAGTTTLYSTGDTEHSAATHDWIHGWGPNVSDQPHPAGRKLANPWGLYDMQGNVFEWCWSTWLMKEPRPQGMITEVQEPPEDQRNVYYVWRGGAYRYGYSGSASRVLEPRVGLSTGQNGRFGGRLAMSAEEVVRTAGFAEVRRSAAVLRVAACMDGADFAIRDVRDAVMKDRRAAAPLRAVEDLVARAQQVGAAADLVQSRGRDLLAIAGAIETASRGFAADEKQRKAHDEFLASLASLRQRLAATGAAGAGRP